MSVTPSPKAPGSSDDKRAEPVLNDLSSDSFFSFVHNSGLDPRLLRALSKLNFVKPTLIQEKAIPLALAGKDVLARAKTGSGKTAAYCLPVIQKILTAKENLDGPAVIRNVTRSLILVPTRELAQQVTKQINQFLVYCSKEIKVVNIGTNVPVEVQRLILSEGPDIVVATPFRALAQLQTKNLVIHALQTLVIDEADLILSYGYEDDMQKLLTYLPKIFQSLIMSATLSKDVETLKRWILRNPVILRLEEEKDELDLLSQYCVLCSEMDKFLIIFVILRLQLIKGKCLIFVNDIDRGYRLKLFLEQFSIKSCVLNSELPLNSRYHIVEEFNKGVYQYIIATDESDLKRERDTDDEDENEDDKDEESSINQAPLQVESSQHLSRKRKKRSEKLKQDKEYGVSRGIDFVNVVAVINFDFPTSAKSYTHRVGRTARANRKGMSLSFIVPKKLVGINKNITCPTAVNDEALFARVEQQQSETGRVIKPYMFDMKQIEGFRYRVEDALKAVTRIAIKEARIKEVKREILSSEKLKAHFEDNPKDLDFLRHDKPLHPTRVYPHMKDIPKYLMPKISTLKLPDSGNGEAPHVGYVPYHKDSTNRYRKHKRKGSKFSGKKRKDDPLKTFQTPGGGKNSLKKQRPS
ncbi:hypothetical protein G9A89_014971 [Geosiphon pyriformis]|nr:hypothetical protein G9A89_014971 [Geosiphon pyriformis]